MKRWTDSGTKESREYIVMEPIPTVCASPAFWSTGGAWTFCMLLESEFTNVLTLAVNKSCSWQHSLFSAVPSRGAIALSLKCQPKSKRYDPYSRYCVFTELKKIMYKNGVGNSCTTVHYFQQVKALNIFRSTGLCNSRSSLWLIPDLSSLSRPHFSHEACHPSEYWEVSQKRIMNSTTLLN